MGGDGYLATGFKNVDGDSDVGKLAACLRCLASLPAVAAYKARSLEMLGLEPGQVAVDVACGLGFDVRKMADRVSPGGRAIGVDDSRSLLEEARIVFPPDGCLEFRLGDAHHLPLPDSGVDAIRVDRALQHIQDPQGVIAEMARVLKPGGRMICAEPDWFTFVIDSEDLETAGLVADRWRAGFRNPATGRQLPRLMEEAGLRDVRMEGHILLVRGLEAVDAVYDLAKTVYLLSEEDKGLRERLSRWLRELRDREAGRAVSASVTLFLAGGRKGG